MAMPKPGTQALETFNTLVKAAPGARIKPMFGNFGAFVGRTMFMGVFGDAVFVRLSEDDRAAALQLPGAALFAPMKGRPMKEYVVLPPGVLSDARKAKTWVRKSLDYATALPAKGSAQKSKGASKRR
jgi:TfoX/Sxy family transcriptional regulator of competence genes